MIHTNRVYRIVHGTVPPHPGAGLSPGRRAVSRLIEAFLAWLCPPEPKRGKGWVSVRDIATVTRPASEVTFSRN